MPGLSSCLGPVASLLLIGVASLTLAAGEAKQDAGFVERQHRAEFACLNGLLEVLRDQRQQPNPQLMHPAGSLLASDRDAVDTVLRRTRALYTEISTMPGVGCIESLGDDLTALEAEAKGAAGKDREGLFVRICTVRRRIALSNPLLDFERLVFMNSGGPYAGHVSGVGPIATTSVAFSSVNYLKDLKTDKTVPPFLYHGRLQYMLDDWRFPPAVDEQPGRWASPRFRSLTYNADNISGTRRGQGIHGLVAVSGWREGKPTFAPLLPPNATVTAGASAGTPLSAGVISQDWDLDFDGERVAFSWIHNRMPNVLTATLDGREVRQLTNTVWGDFDPCFLPDGRIVFRSSRRFVIDRCQPWDGEDYSRRHCSTLYAMKSDGSDVVPLSWHETNEAHPAVDNDGRLVYTRWDYIDRGFNEAQHLWHMYPDGRDPRSFHGNWKRPYWPGDKTEHTPGRPVGEFQAQAIPGTKGRYLCIAGGHHAVVPGSPVVLDINRPDDGGGSQIEQIIDGIGLGDDQGGGVGVHSPWPLGDGFFLVGIRQRSSIGIKKGVKTPPLAFDEGIFLLDRYGNLEPLVMDPSQRAELEYWSVRPLRSRPRPPVIPDQTHQGERRGGPGHKRATLSVMNVYDADFAWPEGRKPAELRVVRVWGRPWARGGSNWPRNGYERGMVGRMSLGTVPIEKDGSAYFEAPVDCQVYFQALDQHGMAIQSMRSGTYTPPGAQVSCRGCHEDKQRPAPRQSMPLAMQRAPSKLKPEPGGPQPQTFSRLVAPLIESKCVACHQKQKSGPQQMDYWSLQKSASWTNGFNGMGAGSPFSRSKAGDVGAAATSLGRTLQKTHTGRLTPEELRRVYLWLDLASLNISDYMHEEEQVQARVVWPWEGDPCNATATEWDRPLGVAVVPADGLAGVEKLLAADDWQQRQVGYEAIRQMGPGKVPVARLNRLVDELVAADRLDEVMSLLWGLREVSPPAYDRATGILTGLVTGKDLDRAFRACDALKFSRADTPAALAAFAAAVQRSDYHLAQCAAEALAGLGERAAPIAGEAAKALATAPPRVTAILADALASCPTIPSGAIEALIRVVGERGSDYTWLGKPEDVVATVPAVKEMERFLRKEVYDQEPGKWEGRQSAVNIAAIAVERSWDRKMITAAARALGNHGAAARAALPAMAKAAALDAGDLTTLAQAATRIDTQAAMQPALELLRQDIANDDRTVRLVTYLGLLAERVPSTARAPVLAAFGQGGYGAQTAAEITQWQASLQPQKEPQQKKKK